MRNMSDRMPRVGNVGLAGLAAIALGVLLVLALVLLGSVFMLGTFLFYDSYASTYEYDVSITIDGETEDAVFIVPLPLHDEDPRIGELHVSGGDRFSGIEHTVVETDNGPMLRVDVDEVREGPRWHTLYLSAQVESDRTIDTRDPREVEPILSPVELLERDLDEPNDDRWPDRRDFDATSTAYIEHGGGEDLDIGVSVWYRGGNDWWSFGWNGNYYETSVWADWTMGDTNGDWIEMHGRHVEGAGSYPTFPPTP